MLHVIVKGIKQEKNVYNVYFKLQMNPKVKFPHPWILDVERNSSLRPGVMTQSFTDALNQMLPGVELGLSNRSD